MIQENGRWIIIFSFFLSACTGSNMNLNYPMPSPTAQGAAIGVVGGAALGSLSNPATGTLIGGAMGGALGAVVGNKVERAQSLEGQLASQGIQVVMVGDEIRIIVPTDNYFYKNSSHLNSNYYPVLDKLVLFIRGIPKTCVRVAGYSDDTICQTRALALTREQAAAVANYLWRRGIAARMIYPEGCGRDSPVSHNQTSEGRAQNRRIEITFCRISHDDDF